MWKKIFFVTLLLITVAAIYFNKSENLNLSSTSDTTGHKTTKDMGNMTCYFSNGNITRISGQFNPATPWQVDRKFLLIEYENEQAVNIDLKAKIPDCLYGPSELGPEGDKYCNITQQSRIKKIPFPKDKIPNHDIHTKQYSLRGGAKDISGSWKNYSSKVRTILEEINISITDEGVFYSRSNEIISARNLPIRVTTGYRKIGDDPGFDALIKNFIFSANDDKEFCHIPIGEPLTKKSCFIGGRIFSDGYTYHFYKRGKVPCGQVCDTPRKRKCSSGTLEGPAEYQYTSCSIESCSKGDSK